MSNIKDYLQAVNKIVRNNAVLPILPANYRCEVCQQESFISACLCEDCISDLPFNNAKTCIKCGCSVLGDNNFCTECANNSAYYERAYSVCEYSGLAKQLVYKLKFGNGGYIADTLARLMANAYLINNLNCDVAVYVPSSKLTLKRRGYCQAQLISSAMCDILKLSQSNCLRKTKDLISQEKLARQQRMENISDCFVVCDNSEIKGKTVLLIDDVKTTGATINECARVLIENKAKQIYVITFASVKQSFVYD